MRIAFVLPEFSRQPIGGYKMVFEYANRLSDEGHQIQILFMNEGKFSNYRIPSYLKKIMVNRITQIEPKWFNLNRGIEKISSYEHNFKQKLQTVDAVFATAVETVEPVENFFPNSKKFYLIQDYESWRKSDSYLQSTFQIGMVNIVVSQWLKSIVDIYTEEPSILIRNPIDTNAYTYKQLSKSRKPHTIGLLYHESPTKGLKYSMEVLNKLKQKYPDLQVSMFGIPPRPVEFPKWIQYTRGASQEETVQIYNSVQVFLCGSVQEGFGLTGLEAMACGAALVTTDYQGAQEYAVNNHNALVAPVRDVEKLTRSVVRLFENPDLRDDIVSNAVEDAAEFSWDEAMNKMDLVLQQNVE